MQPAQAHTLIGGNYTCACAEVLHVVHLRFAANQYGNNSQMCNVALSETFMESLTVLFQGRSITIKHH